MKIIPTFFAVFALVLVSGCSSTVKVSVYDSDTMEPVPDAYVYVNEFEMFSPFNESNLYTTNSLGSVEISQRLKDGQANIYAGKAGYALALYNGKYQGVDSINIYISKLSQGQKFKLRELPIRENLLMTYESNTALQEFIKYCSLQGVKIYKSPDRELFE